MSKSKRTRAAVLAAVVEWYDPMPEFPITTTDVAYIVGVSRQTARRHLMSLVDGGKLRRERQDDPVVFPFVWDEWYLRGGEVTA